MRSVLAASPLSLGALCTDSRAVRRVMENPKLRPLESVRLLLVGLGAPVIAGEFGRKTLQGSPYPQLVDKLGNFI